MYEDRRYKTAIVILNWNGKHFLEKFLPPLINYSTSDDTLICIADNGSKDNSVSYVKENHPEIKLILFDKNYGFTGGYNRALKQLDADYFVLLNSDVEVTQNWLEPIISMMDKDSMIAAAMPKIKSYDVSNYFEYAGASGGFIDKYGYPFCRGRIIAHIEEDNNQYESIRDVFWASGAAMFVRADLFKQFGGLDVDFFAHMEEIDLCWRFKNAGYTIKVNPQSTVYHVGGGTLPNNSPGKIYYNYRNNLSLLLKNLTKRKILPIIFSRLVLDGLSGFIYLISFKFGFFFAVLKAHLHFYLSIRKIKRKRTEIKVSNHKEIYKKSIVFTYFFAKKRRFDQLEF